MQLANPSPILIHRNRSFAYSQERCLEGLEIIRQYRFWI